jgi:hypothetical protein
MKRLAIPSGLVFMLTFALTAPVLAAAPANDTYPGTIIGSPFSETLDTTEATSDADDADINATCGAPATDASVWYQFTATSDMAIVVDVSQSDYSAGVIVATGVPGNFEVIACGPGLVGFGATAGVTYTILAFDDQDDGGGNGGTLVISVGEAPPPPEIDVTVDPVGTFDPHTGSATISGTVVCSSDAEFAFIDVELRQDVGRFVISGFGSVDVVCDGTSQSWSVEVFGDNGLFKGGHAVAVTFALACGALDCGTDFDEQTVKLRR